ncbi:hypothetical protein AB0N05_10415 [Nocardia sp. NPDC051030]|uniref:hypothetical protein n=1 Tax=Nocardia sp. NPDC051030 TaxID=3155162 RepID=UPI0034235C79
MLGLIEIRVWALFLGIAAAWILFVNVPHVLHPQGGTEAPVCEGRTMAQGDLCRVDVRGTGVKQLGFEEMQQRDRDGHHDTAVIWTIVGSGAAFLSVLFVVPMGKSRKLSARSGKRGKTASAARPGRTPRAR